MSELLTVPEAAALLRMSVAATYAAIERGTIPGTVRLGRKVRIRAAELRRHLGLTTAPPPPYSSALASTGSERTR